MRQSFLRLVQELGDGGGGGGGVAKIWKMWPLIKSGNHEQPLSVNLLTVLM